MGQAYPDKSEGDLKALQYPFEILIFNTWKTKLKGNFDDV